MVWCSEGERSLSNTIVLSKVDRKRSRQRLSLNEMWRNPEDCVAWGKRVSRDASNGLLHPTWELSPNIM